MEQLVNENGFENQGNENLVEKVNPKKQYKKQVKKDVGKTTLLLVILIVASNLIGLIIGLVVCVIYIINQAGSGVDIYELMKKLDPNFGLAPGLFNVVMSMVPILIAEFILLLIARPLLKVKIKQDIFCKNELEPKNHIVAIFACLGAGSLGGLIAAGYMSIFESFGIVIPSPNFTLPKNEPIALVMFLCYVCILGPILEEIIFRGFILKSLQKHGELFAIILSSILFSLFHQNLVQFVPPFIVGLALGFITIKARSIVPAIICHIANNSISMILEYFFPEKSQYNLLANYVYMGVMLIAFIAIVIIYKKSIKQTPKGDGTIIKTGKKIMVGFSSAWSIVFVVLVIAVNIIMFVAPQVTKL